MLMHRRPGAERVERSGHVSKLSLVLSVLAVVIASTGTAVAVTVTTVQIADPGTPSNISRVDSKGRLSTTGPTATITNSGLLYGYQSADNYITSPTSATLAITHLSFAESSVSLGVAGSAVRVILYKTGSSGATCTQTGYQQLAYYQVDAGDDIVADFAQPLVVAPTGSAKYCLDLYVYQVNSNAALSYLPSYNFTAYVASGAYGGIGGGGGPAAVPPKTTTHGDAK